MPAVIWRLRIYVRISDFAVLDRCTRHAHLRWHVGNHERTGRTLAARPLKQLYWNMRWMLEKSSLPRFSSPCLCIVYKLFANEPIGTEEPEIRAFSNANPKSFSIRLTTN